MIMKDRRPYLARLLAVDLVLLAAGAMTLPALRMPPRFQYTAARVIRVPYVTRPLKGLIKPPLTSTPTIKSTATAGAQESTTPVQRMA
jgi:hypothetical protein